jgi:hypothetical protein
LVPSTTPAVRGDGGFENRGVVRGEGLARGILHRKPRTRGDRQEIDMAIPEPQNRDEAEEMMRDPRYWQERDPKFIEAAHRGFQRTIGTGVNVRASKACRLPSGKKAL